MHLKNSFSFILIPWLYSWLWESKGLHWFWWKVNLTALSVSGTLFSWYCLNCWSNNSSPDMLLSKRLFSPLRLLELFYLSLLEIYELISKMFWSSESRDYISSLKLTFDWYMLMSEVHEMDISSFWGEPFLKLSCFFIYVFAFFFTSFTNEIWLLFIKLDLMVFTVSWSWLLVTLLRSRANLFTRGGFSPNIKLFSSCTVSGRMPSRRSYPFLTIEVLMLRSMSCLLSEVKSLICYKRLSFSCSRKSIWPFSWVMKSFCLESSSSFLLRSFWSSWCKSSIMQSCELAVFIL